MKAVSDTVRAHAQDAVAAEAQTRERHTSDRLARRHVNAVATEVGWRITECARRIARKVHNEPDRWTVATLRHDLRRWREVFDDALDHATARRMG